MDAVLLDPQRLYDATLCCPDEFDYILHLYEGWLKRNGKASLSYGWNAGGRANRGTMHPRHVLLMLLADKKANVPMEMLADLFGTHKDVVNAYLLMTNMALIEALSIHVPRDIDLVPPDNDLTNFNISVPAASPGDIIRSRTAKNYPGLLPSERASGTDSEDVNAAERRVEEARVARTALSPIKRIKQYRRMTDPYTGFPGLDTEAAVISGLENIHLTWDQIRRKNGPLLLRLAKKRDSWGVA